jgi:hypothetical protein
MKTSTEQGTVISGNWFLFTADLSWKLDSPTSNSLKFGDERNRNAQKEAQLKNHL